MDNKLGVKLAWGFAVAFALAALMGVIPNPLVGPDALFVTNTAHNLVHLLTAFGFASVALVGDRASTRFMQAFGVIYLLVGLYGFIALGGASEGHLLGLVHINFLDNFLHLGLGASIAVAGYVSSHAAEAGNAVSRQQV